MLTPRDYQVEAVSSLYTYFSQHPTGNPVVAMPTGTGKSVVIAMFVESALRMYSRQKILVATHVKELIDQNYKELMGMWPTAPAGIYSAGLGKRDVHSTITFCGIASIINHIDQFGKIDLMLIDECHLISQNDESMYLTAIAALMARNPNMKVIGFTATPWRAGQGVITDNGIFTDICFDVTSMQAFNRFIKEGYLMPLVPKATQTLLDVTGVHMRGGDFIEKELQLAVDKDEITYAALQEAIAEGRDRKHWLVFASGVKHARKITDMLNYLGISARCVHSNTKHFKMSNGERDTNIREWKEGKFTAIVNNGVLTTGINFKAIDMIIMLRPTHSTVLWIQMLGRGTRPSPETDKQNCLVLDFAGNTRRLGPINDPVLPRKRGESKGEVPIKLCDTCGMFNHISARYCGGQPYKTNEGCGTEFIFKVLIKQSASSDVLIRDDTPIVEDFEVKQITFNLHQKMGKPDSVRVSYYCALNKWTEYVLPEHKGFGERKAREWWTLRSTEPFPESTDEFLKRASSLRVPSHVKVWVNALPFPKILNVSFVEGFNPTMTAPEPITILSDDDIPF